MSDNQIEVSYDTNQPYFKFGISDTTFKNTLEIGSNFVEERIDDIKNIPLWLIDFYRDLKNPNTRIANLARVVRIIGKKAVSNIPQEELIKLLSYVSKVDPENQTDIFSKWKNLLDEFFSVEGVKRVKILEFAEQLDKLNTIDIGILDYISKRRKRPEQGYNIEEDWFKNQGLEMISRLSRLADMQLLGLQASNGGPVYGNQLTLIKAYVLTINSQFTLRLPDSTIEFMDYFS